MSLSRLEHTKMERFLIQLKMITPRFRVFLGFCPLCNSDAPELDCCPLCDGYHRINGDEYPPPTSLRRDWLKQIRVIFDTQLRIKKVVRESRKQRLATRN
jgi:hypothetical protein